MSNNALSNAYAELDELRKAYHVLQAENAELKNENLRLRPDASVYWADGEDSYESALKGR